MGRNDAAGGGATEAAAGGGAGGGGDGGAATGAAGGAAFGVAGGAAGAFGGGFGGAGWGDPAGGAGSSLSFRRRNSNMPRVDPPTVLDCFGPGRGIAFSSRASTPAMPPTASERIRENGLTLPPPPKPAGTYSPVVVSDRRAWVSGQIVTEGGSVVHPGLVDRDVSFDVAHDLARRASLQAVSALATALGSVDRVRRVERVIVYVASSPGFVRQHEVANGATEVLVQIWGEDGRPARAAVGVAALPLNAPVEVEVVVRTY